MKRPASDPSLDLWIFAYGSLMWDPGFVYVEDQPGTLFGFHRCLCVRSTIYRGAPENPGLVLGLDRGGSCRGRAFRVAAEHVNATLAYLDEREQVTKVYCQRFVKIKLADGRTVNGYTFVVRREHEQYTRLSLDEQARLVAQGAGLRGTALDYLANTVEHLDALGIPETRLRRVLEMAQTISSLTSTTLA
jgi:cation transport protein ChaC